MSQSHIPQPDAGTAAEVFDSVSDAAVQPVVSALGQPAGPPGEIPIHTGQRNNFDMSIMRQWIPVEVIIWSVTMPSGTLIYKKPIHPSYCNGLLAYLGGIYNTWGGSIDWRFKVAGTGFHAGAIAIVRIPPNRNPEEFTTPSDWGAFEYLVIDPKTLETESVGVSDQRPIAFHYFPFKESDPLSYGGWIAVYVLIPLNTSATGSQQIAIQAFSRPGATFQFSQLVMPAVNPKVDVFPSEFMPYFDFTDQEVMTTTGFPVKQISIGASTETQTFYVANCYSVSGKHMSKWIPKTAKPDCAKVYNRTFTGFGGNIGTSFRFAFNDWYPIIRPKDNTNFIACSFESTQRTESWDASTIKAVFSNDENGTGWDFSKQATDLTALQCMTASATDFQLSAEYTDNAYSAVGPGESILHFTMGKEYATIKSVQTMRMTELFKSGRLAQTFYSGVCILFTIISKDENLPIGYVKLYEEGFMTSRSTKDAVLFNSPANIKLRFSGIVSRTDPIPSNSEYNKNLLMYRAISQLK